MEILESSSPLSEEISVSAEGSICSVAVSSELLSRLEIWFVPSSLVLTGVICSLAVLSGSMTLVTNSSGVWI